MINYNEILKCFPQKVSSTIDKFFRQDEKNISNYLEEIRIRSNKPIILKIGQTQKILEYITTAEDILETLQYICENSIYSYQNQICNGYITIRGGHRVGISGNIVFNEDKVLNVNYISSLNFRISRQVIGCSTKALKYILETETNNIYNTLIVSPPGAGKTTLLRDIVRRISNGMENINFKGKTIGLVDERGELASMFKGIPQNDIGIRTDVLDNIPKAIGMKMLIRSMSPEIIVADEIGSLQDVEAINYAMCCGIKGIFTAHGGSVEDLNLNPSLENIIDKHIFERLIFLTNSGPKGEIESVYALNKVNKEYILI